MTNPDGDTPTTAPQQQTTAAAESGVKSEFLERVGEIPVVNAAKEAGTIVYNQVKQMNRFTAAALSVAETAALYFAVTAKPFLEKVQPQAHMVDQLACSGLDVVQDKAPFLLKNPEELVEDARKLCSSTVEAGYQKVEVMKAMGTETLTNMKAMGTETLTNVTTMGTETLTNVKNYGIQKANEALTGTEGLVEKYLPPAFGEGSPETTTEATSVPERAKELTSKIGLRLYGHSVKQLLPVHKLSQEYVSKLVYTVELIQSLKENYSKKSAQEIVDEAKVKATWVWGELNKEPAAATAEAEKSLEQRLLSLARRTTSILVHSYNVAAVPLSSLPKTYQEGVQTASKYATELFAQFDQATNAGEMTVSLLQGVRTKLADLEGVVRNLASQSEQIEMEDLSKSKGSGSAAE